MVTAENLSSHKYKKIYINMRKAFWPIQEYLCFILFQNTRSICEENFICNEESN